MAFHIRGVYPECAGQSCTQISRGRLQGAGFCGNIFARQFGTSIALGRQVTETRYRRIKATASNDVARPGPRIALRLEVELKAGMALYTPCEQRTFRIGRSLGECHRPV